VRWNESAWLDRFSALLSQGASILDIGCGSGEPIAKYLIDRGFAVDGVDTLPTLIALRRERFPQRSRHVADKRTLALEGTFDGLLARDSSISPTMISAACFHFLGDMAHLVPR
jgi:SAM-dependent methyltransferase